MQLNRNISLLIMIVFLFLLAGPARAEQVDKGNAITINPLDLFGSAVDVTFQAGLGKGNLALGVEYSLIPGPMGAYLGYNFNLNGNRLQGFQLGPHVGLWSHAATTLQGVSTPAWLGITPMLEASYQWIWSNGFTLKPAASIGYNFSLAPAVGNSLAWDFCLNIGYAF